MPIDTLLKKDITFEDFSNGIIAEFKIPVQPDEEDPRDLIKVFIRCLYEIRTSIPAEKLSSNVKEWVLKAAKSYYFTAPEFRFEGWRYTAFLLESLTEKLDEDVRLATANIFRDYRS